MGSGGSKQDPNKGALRDYKAPFDKENSSPGSPTREEEKVVIKNGKLVAEEFKVEYEEHYIAPENKGWFAPPKWLAKECTAVSEMDPNDIKLMQRRWRVAVQQMGQKKCDVLQSILDDLRIDKSISTLLCGSLVTDDRFDMKGALGLACCLAKGKPHLQRRLIFELVDRDGSGKLSVSELLKMLKHIYPDGTEDYLNDQARQIIRVVKGRPGAQLEDGDIISQKEWELAYKRLQEMAAKEAARRQKRGSDLVQSQANEWRDRNMDQSMGGSMDMGGSMKMGGSVLGGLGGSMSGSMLGNPRQAQMHSVPSIQPINASTGMTRAQMAQMEASTRSTDMGASQSGSAAGGWMSGSIRGASQRLTKPEIMGIARAESFDAGGGDSPRLEGSQRYPSRGGQVVHLPEVQAVAQQGDALNMTFPSGKKSGSSRKKGKEKGPNLKHFNSAGPGPLQAAKAQQQQENNTKVMKVMDPKNKKENFALQQALETK